jgi:DNA-binding NarL/FixJ family response regulator
MTQGLSGRIRVLLVDDHTLVREGVSQILDAEDDLAVVGHAATSQQAVRLAGSARPDVVLLDVRIPGWPAPATVARIRAASPLSRVVILSMSDEPAAVRRLLERGVNGYLLKSVTRHELVASIRSVHRDPRRIVLSISQSCLAQLGERTTGLSTREGEVLALAAEAYTNSQIATKLDIAEGTVKRHLRNIFKKLGAISRIDAVNKAVDQSLLGEHGRRLGRTNRRGSS